MRELTLPSKPASIANADLELVGGPYSARTAGEIFAMETLSSSYLLPTVPVGEYGASAVFVGEPGLGKSRFVLQLLAAQAAGVGLFCGMPLDPTPRRTLVIQAENSLPRIQQDLSWFAREANLTAVQRKNLSENLLLTTLESDLDGDISIDDSDPESGNFIRLKALIRDGKPQVVAIDPWSAMCLDELAAKSIRTTFIAVRRACNAANSGPVTVILLAHAKPGIQARASARGADALSYCRGNRNLVGIMRSVINLRPCEFIPDEPLDPRLGDEMGVRRGIEVIWAKSNNGVLPDPIAVWLNPETFLYEKVPNFPHQLWQEQLERQAKSGSFMSPAQKARETAEALTSVQERIANLLRKTGPLGRVEITNRMLELGMSSSKRGAIDMVKWLVSQGQLVMWQRAANRAAKYGLPEQFKEKAG